MLGSERTSILLYQQAIRWRPPKAYVTHIVDRTIPRPVRFSRSVATRARTVRKFVLGFWTTLKNPIVVKSHMGGLIQNRQGQKHKLLNCPCGIPSCNFSDFASFAFRGSLLSTRRSALRANSRKSRIIRAPARRHSEAGCL